MEPTDSGIMLTVEPGNAGQKPAVIAAYPDNTSFVDRVDLADSIDRERFVDAALKGRDESLRPAFEEALLKLASEFMRDPRRTRADDSRGSAVSMSMESRSAIPRYIAFPEKTLPEPVRSFVREGAMAIGCDPALVALPLLSALAARIGNSRVIELKPGWHEPAVLWTAVAVESGGHKTPAFDLALSEPRRAHERQLAAHLAAESEHETAMVRWEAELAEWKKKRKGDPPPRPQQPPAERFLCTEITIEALVERLQASPRGLLLGRDELAGWFQDFDAYRQGKGSDVAQWLEIHRAGQVTVDRKTGAQKVIFVPRAAVSICGTIQPATLQRVLTPAYFSNGLAARLLVAMPPRRAKRWTEACLSEQALADMRRTFERLGTLECERDENGWPTPKVLTLTPEAKRLWIEFYNDHAEEQLALTGDLAAAWAKLEGYAARFALVIHCAKWAGDSSQHGEPGSIDAASMTEAIELMKWFAWETERVYGALAEAPEQRESRELVELIERKGGRISVRELMKASRIYRGSAAKAEATLNGLVASGLGRWASRPTTDQGGHPTKHFELLKAAKPNPAGDTTPTEGGANGVVVPSPPGEFPAQADGEWWPHDLGFGVKAEVTNAIEEVDLREVQGALPRTLTDFDSSESASDQFESKASSTTLPSGDGTRTPLAPVSAGVVSPGVSRA